MKHENCQTACLDFEIVTLITELCTLLLISKASAGKDYTPACYVVHVGCVFQIQSWPVAEVSRKDITQAAALRWSPAEEGSFQFSFDSLPTSVPAGYVIPDPQCGSAVAGGMECCPGQ